MTVAKAIIKYRWQNNFHFYLQVPHVYLHVPHVYLQVLDVYLHVSNVCLQVSHVYLKFCKFFQQQPPTLKMQKVFYNLQEMCVGKSIFPMKPYTS